MWEVRHKGKSFQLLLLFNHVTDTGIRLGVCGIITILCKESSSIGNDQAKRILTICRDMVATLRFRGPDEENVVQFGNAFLGHSRLSIIDLITGSQPIFNEEKSVAVLLNGEIYNFLELREELKLKGHHFATLSDTEVIVHLYEEVGEEVFSRLNGMFAIVICDLENSVLLAGRDRAGEKPLLYWDSGSEIVLASELKAILRHPQFRREIDNRALSLYFNCIYIPAPFSIFKGVKKLLPAHYMVIKDGKVDIKQYWNPKIEIEWEVTEQSIVDEYVPLFADAVKRRIVSDVPKGVFLSGGIDSSAVTALMAMNSEEPIKTFSVGFADVTDERPYAKMVAERYKTDHHELFVKDNIEDVFEKVIAYFDEPFGDSSAIPTYLISKEARKHVKVILTGDGGDELFAGYDSYIDQKYQVGGRITTKALRILNELCSRGVGFNFLEQFYPRTSGEWAGRHWLWVRTVLSEKEIKELLLARADGISEFFAHNQWLEVKGLDALSKAYCHDLNFYLPDDLLKKVDMASMLTSLECRAPFLDHKLIEFSLKIPPHLKVKNDQLKYILKKALADYLPREILYRKKTGFGAPVESWLRNQLKEMTHDLLAPGCKSESFLDRKGIQGALDAVYKGKENNDYRIAYRLWLILVFEVWARAYM